MSPTERPRLESAGRPTPEVRGTEPSREKGTSRPRLLLLTPDFPPSRGGIQVMSERFATEIKGFDTLVVTRGGAGARAFDATAPVRVRRARLPAAAPAPLGNAQLNLSALVGALGFRPDATLSIHLVLSPAARAIRAAFHAPVVQVFHAQEIGGKPRLAAFAASHADAVIAVSSYTAGLIAQTGAKVGSLHLISPGVDLPADPRGLPVERPTFVTVARLKDRYKGHDLLVRALALLRDRVPDVEWVVIGDGPLRMEIEALARSAGVAESVRFLGSISDEERDRWLARANLLAMPSRLPEDGLAGEGFGIAYLEAGAFGKPVVAGAAGGALDAVVHGETGLLVDPTDAAALADSIERLLLDRELARRMGSAAAVRARDFAWPVIARRVEAVLLETLRARAARSATRSKAA